MKKTALLFPGQGSQYPGMAKDLYENFKIAKDTFEEASDSLSFNLSKLCFEGPAEELTLTKNAQPAILTHSVALLRVIENESGYLQNNSGVFHSAGHSLGEYSALVSNDTLRFFDAVKTVSLRGEFMQSACEPGFGTMAAIIGLTAGKIDEVCSQLSNESSFVVPANFNSENQIVISGETNTVLTANAEFKNLGARVFPLSVSAPFHSPYMRKAAEKLSPVLNSITINKPKFSYIANYDAKVYDQNTQAALIKENLVKQVYSPVRWHETMKRFSELTIETALEIGPGKVLTGMLKKADKNISCINIENYETLKKFLESL